MFLVCTWIELGLHVGFAAGAKLLVFVLIALNLALIILCVRKATDLRWRLRLLFYPLMLNILFSHLKFVIPQIHPLPMDTLLHHIDSALVGTNLSLRLESLGNPVLTEVL